MKQRLQIARGLINNPDYLFLDEPTLGLDAPIARQLRKTVQNLAKEDGKGILLTSHYLQEVTRAVGSFLFPVTYSLFLVRGSITDGVHTHWWPLAVVLLSLNGMFLAATIWMLRRADAHDRQNGSWVLF